MHDAVDVVGRIRLVVRDARRHVREERSRAGALRRIQAQCRCLRRKPRQTQQPESRDHQRDQDLDHREAALATAHGRSRSHQHAPALDRADPVGVTITHRWMTPGIDDFTVHRVKVSSSHEKQNGLTIALMQAWP